MKHLLTAAMLLLITTASSAAVLQPGTGTWSADFFTEDTVGTGPGYDANAIARWDVVPFQTIDTAISIGIVAFHINGIERVDFSLEGGAAVSVTEMTLNPRVNVTEYQVDLDPALASDGKLRILAVAVPVIGVPRILDTLVLFNNAGGSLAEPAAYVTPSTGDDLNDGSEMAPYKTLKKAISTVGDGGNVYLTEAGAYVIPYRATAKVVNDRYITVQPGDGLVRDDIILTAIDSGTVDAQVRRVHWKNITVDFSRLSRFYGSTHWFDTVKWWHKEGRAANMGTVGHPTTTYFVTNSLATNLLYGFVSSDFVRNSTVEYISGDAFQNAACVINCTVRNMDGGELEHHTDISQYFGTHPNNVIIYGLRAHGINATQSIFMGHNNTTLPYVDFAFVNCLYDFNAPTASTPLSQMQISANDTTAKRVTFKSSHLLLWHVTLQQRFNFRDDGTWDGDNVSVVGCSFQGAGGFTDDGRCRIRDCHFTDTTSYGLNAYGTGATGGTYPMFADTAADDFYPAAGSPLRDRVTNLVVPVDINNSPRTSPASVGALEYGGTTSANKPQLTGHMVSGRLVLNALPVTAGTPVSLAVTGTGRTVYNQNGDAVFQAGATGTAQWTGSGTGGIYYIVSGGLVQKIVVLP